MSAATSMAPADSLALKLPAFARYATEVAQKAEREGWTCGHYLHHLAELEVEERRRRHVDPCEHRRAQADRCAPDAHDEGHDESAQPDRHPQLPRARAPSGAPLRRRPRVGAGTARSSWQGRRMRPRSGAKRLSTSEHGATVGRRRRKCAGVAGRVALAGGYGDLRGRGCGRHVPMMPTRRRGRASCNQERVFSLSMLFRAREAWAVRPIAPGRMDPY